MTHLNATPGKAIYLDEFIYEEGTPIGKCYQCDLPNPFTNNQVLTEGIDYVKQWQIRTLGLTEWNNCTQKEYETTYSFPQERRIKALPLQAEKPEGEKEIKITRAWAMPNKNTFLIKPIAELISRYVGDGKNWIDPFAGDNSPAEVTNDLNHKKKTMFHRHATDFAQVIVGDYDGVLFDPPYSLRQLKECYDEIDTKMFKDDSQRFPQNVKEAITPKIKIGGYAISFGWNSQGFGKNLGFEIVEILLVAHGRSHNDTIVTVERKINHQ